ncbi:MAG: 3'-5' exonuclease [Eubacteriales bacterium]
MNRIIAFDVETPNRRNDRICSIGLTIIENGEVVDSFYYLVNPECEFDPLNIDIHGIHPGDVASAPTFDKVWNEIGSLFRENLVAAHNATFDLCVLKKVLSHYHYDETIINYICTVDLSRANNHKVFNHKLSTLCDYFGIHHDHHNAVSDSNACACILCNYINTGIDLNQYTKGYNLFFENNTVSSAYCRTSSGTQALLQLNEILDRITFDNILTEDEVINLENWMDANNSLQGNYPYDNIYNILFKALADGILEKQELDEMLPLFKKLYDPVSDCNCSDILVYGKNVCLSGEFDRGSKSEISKELVSLGATMQNSVTQKTDCLIVGGQGSSAWCTGNYGTKVKKALEMQSKGSEIVIVREADFFNVLKV